MRFQIPLTLSDLEILKRRSKGFIFLSKQKKVKLDEYLAACGVNINGAQYMAICYKKFLINLLILTTILTTIFGFLSMKWFYFYGLGLSILISGFIFINQTNYPKIFALNKTRAIEKNLIPALQDILVQLNSGVPLFRILMNISQSDYGEVSEEIKRITKEINSGMPEIEAIENYAKINTSLYFRRVLWQISNGMRSGSDMAVVIKESIKDLNEEQSIQIQSYGSKLNPLIMFYMIIAVILPALGITFLIIISSFLNLSGDMVRLFFLTVFAFIIFIQIMFLGLIKSRRPSLL